MPYARYFTDNPPKQLRSKETLQKLLTALDELLVDHYFEQIKVTDICSKAGVSVGNFYRRFKSKDELLPYLYKIAKYEYFNWFQTLIEKGWHGDLNARIEQLIQATIWYHQRDKHIFKTTQLYTRLHPQTADNQKREMSLYKQLLDSWQDCTEGYDSDALHQSIEFIGYVLTVIVADWVVFNHCAPAVNFEINQRTFISQTTVMFQAYLARCQL
ncbi:MAG: AcrR family transcriptional regulator [Phenylobacterium sp.]|jgi:AcrR family transcriptional regulator